jgi:hypothetical protein
MRRATNAADITEIIEEAVATVVSRTSKAIDEAISAAVQRQLQAELKRSEGRGRALRSRSPRRGRSARSEITKWIADRRARRVPTFVIEATGLERKKDIVARYGANVAFEKGKSAPSPVDRAVTAPQAQKTTATLKAKPPIVRKKFSTSRG